MTWLQRGVNEETDTGKGEMETIKEEDTPPSSVNTTREDNDSSSPAVSPSSTCLSQEEAPVSSANHVTSVSHIQSQSEMTPLPDDESQLQLTSLSDSKSQSESTSPSSAVKTVTLNLTRSQSDCHATSDRRSRLARPCHKENTGKKSGV